MARRLSRETAEIIVGACAFVAFAIFVVFAFNINQKAISGYPLRATYNHIDGLALHADVRLAGIRIGEVVDERFEPAQDQALVVMMIESGVEIPRDSAAIIATDGLLGGKFIKIEPGGDSEMLPPGGRFDYVQDSVDFERLLERIVREAEGKRKAAPEKPGGKAN